MDKYDKELRNLKKYDVHSVRPKQAVFVFEALDYIKKTNKIGIKQRNILDTFYKNAKRYNAVPTIEEAIQQAKELCKEGNEKLVDAYCDDPYKELRKFLKRLPEKYFRDSSTLWRYMENYVD